MQSALAGCARGESSAFATIVQEHQAMVFSIALHYLRDRSLAEDLGQEVFLELYQKVAGIQSADHLTYWLRRVTENPSIDQGGTKKHPREEPLERSPQPRTRPPPARTP